MRQETRWTRGVGKSRVAARMVAPIAALALLLSLLPQPASKALAEGVAGATDGVAMTDETQGTTLGVASAGELAMEGDATDVTDASPAQPAAADAEDDAELVVQANDAAQTGESAYVKFEPGNSDYATNGFNIQGKVGGHYVSTTYDNRGFITQMMVGSTITNFCPFEFGKEYTCDGISASVTAEAVGRRVEITYVLKNTGDTDKTVKIGSSGDVQVGTSKVDSVSFVDDSILMTDGTNSFVVKPGDGGFTTRWMGKYNDWVVSIDNDGNVDDPVVFQNGKDVSSGGNGDSAVAWSWTVEVPAGQTVTKTASSTASNGSQVVPPELSDAQKPTAKELTYNGSAQVLVSAPAEALPQGYAMRYAVITSNAAPREDDFTYDESNLPTGTDADTYHVWYRAVSEDASTDPECVIATIAPLEAALEWSGTTVTYDGKTHKPTASVSNRADGDNCSVTVEGEGTDAGSYTAEATALSNDNYKLPATATSAFTIKPAAITSVSKPADATYTGKAQKPSVTVKAGSATLKASTDYTVSYKNNTNAGTATVTVTAKGNYTGSKSATFKIKPAAITSVSKPADATYTGKAQKPSVTVKAGSATLKASADYTVAYKNNTNAGTATVTVTAKGNYTGSKSATFKIKPAAITSVSKPADVTYTGKAQKPSVTVKAGSATLKAGTDYTVAYKNNTNAGTATVTVTAKGNYTGSKSATFKIKPAAITSVSKPADATYTGKAIKPTVTVKAGSKTLKANTDYTVSYANNTEVSIATVTVKGTGNYTGTKKVTFKIKKPNAVASVSYRAYTQGLGWLSATDGDVCGTSGESRRIEAILLRLASKPVPGSIEYRVHIQDQGWQKTWSKDGQRAGQAGSGKRVEAVQIRLTDDMADKYDVYYRVHVQDVGWMGWAKNGESAGTAARLKRLEAIQVVLVKKGAKAPATTYKGVARQQAKAFIAG